MSERIRWMINNPTLRARKDDEIACSGTVVSVSKRDLYRWKYRYGDENESRYPFNFVIEPTYFYSGNEEPDSDRIVVGEDYA